MAEPRGRTAVPRAVQNASRGISALLARFPASRLAILVLGGVGGALMIASDFLTLYRVHVVSASCADLATPNLRDACATSGGGHHGYALAILGAIALVMAWGAAIGRSRPAGVALLVVAAAALAVALGVDLPDIHHTGIIGDQFTSAEARPAGGFWAELAATALVALAGVIGVLRR